LEIDRRYTVINTSVSNIQNNNDDYCLLVSEIKGVPLKI